jgi:hypothetical protein
MSLTREIGFLKTLALPQPSWGGRGCLKIIPYPGDFDIRSIPKVAARIKAGIPDSADLTHLIQGPIYNQGGEGACVAFSTAGLCSMDDVTETGKWQTMDAEQMYHSAGGTGQNGVDSRLVLQQATDNGVPILGGGGSAKLLKSYAFVPQQPGVFRDAIKAAIAAGLPVTLALLLPSDWGWQSGHGSRTSGYHQVCGVGYTADGYLICLNSWGAQWCHNGVGSVLFDYLEADTLQNQYCYSYTVTTLDIPNPTPVPIPTPIPVPVPTPVTAAIKADAGGPGAGSLVVGQRLLVPPSLALVVTDVVLNQPTPDPGPNPTPKPDPKPNPTPVPGALTIKTNVAGPQVEAWVNDANGPVSAVCALTVGGVSQGKHQTKVTPSGIYPAVWITRAKGAGLVTAVVGDRQGVSDPFTV